MIAEPFNIYINDSWIFRTIVTTNGNRISLHGIIAGLLFETGSSLRTQEDIIRLYYNLKIKKRHRT